MNKAILSAFVCACTVLSGCSTTPTVERVVVEPCARGTTCVDSYDTGFKLHRGTTSGLIQSSTDENGNQSVQFIHKEHEKNALQQAIEVVVPSGAHIAVGYRAAQASEEGDRRKSEAVERAAEDMAHAIENAGPDTVIDQTLEGSQAGATADSLSASKGGDASAGAGVDFKAKLEAEGGKGGKANAISQQQTSVTSKNTSTVKNSLPKVTKPKHKKVVKKAPPKHKKVVKKTPLRHTLPKPPPPPAHPPVMINKAVIK